jgi:hypothetical protein
VDEKKFNVEEAVALVETGFDEVLPFVQTIVSAVTAGNSWGNVLRRYLIGESIRIRVDFGGDAGVFCYPQSTPANTYFALLPNAWSWSSLVAQRFTSLQPVVSR